VIDLRTGEPTCRRDLDGTAVEDGGRRSTLESDEIIGDQMMSSHGHSHVQSRGEAAFPHPDERDLLEMKERRLMIRSLSVVIVISFLLLSS